MATFFHGRIKKRLVLCLLLDAEKADLAFKVMSIEDVSPETTETVFEASSYPALVKETV